MKTENPLEEMTVREILTGIILLKPDKKPFKIRSLEKGLQSASRKTKESQRSKKTISTPSSTPTEITSTTTQAYHTTD